MIGDLNKAFESRVRLGIMSALVVNESMNFTTLRALLEITDGNLASHLKALESLDYIQVNKKFIDRKPNTDYTVTGKGKEAFQDHIAALEEIIKRTG